MFTVGDSPPNISAKLKRTTNSTTVDSTSGWKSSLGKIYKQNSARARTSTLNSARVTVQRRQTLSTGDRGYTATTNKSKQRNTTVTLQTKPTKRGNTDCRRFSKIRSIEFARRGKFRVKIIFFDATTGSKNYTICKIDTRSIFATD